MTRRRKILLSVATLVVVFGIVVGTSVVSYVLANPGVAVQQNVAQWARNHKLGAVVNVLELWLRTDPPSTEEATELGLATDNTNDIDDSTMTTMPPTTVPATTSTITATSVAAQTSTTTTNPADIVANTTATGSQGDIETGVPAPVPTTTTVPDDPALPYAGPQDITPVLASPLRGEGKWTPIAKLQGSPVAWATSLRPSRKYGSVVASVAVIDQSRVRAAMYNGNELPGGGPWTNGNKVQARAVPALVASFNGGFRWEHTDGGYMAEGKIVRPLKKGLATLAISPDGQVSIGVYGRDFTNDGSWRAMRQNLPPVVLKGRNVVRDAGSVNWGEDFHDKVYTLRSGACIREDGKLMHVTVGDADIHLLADTLVYVGCETAMQLDITGQFPQFVTYTSPGKDNRDGKVLDKRMSNANRTLKGWMREFFAFFNPERLPDGVVD